MPKRLAGLTESRLEFLFNLLKALQTGRYLRGVKVGIQAMGCAVNWTVMAWTY
jgi:hypothetical protein